MADSDMIKLYSGRILELAADIPHHGRLDTPQISVKKRSPLCGSSVIVDMVVADGRVTEFAQDVKACALGQASAAIAGANLLGRTRHEVETARDELAAMLKSGEGVPAAPFDGYEVLAPAKDYKNRHASIMLVLDAATEAFAKAEEGACV